MSREEYIQSLRAKIAEINALIESNSAEIEQIERKIAIIRAAQTAIVIACVISVIALCVIVYRKAKRIRGNAE